MTIPDGQKHFSVTNRAVLRHIADGLANTTEPAVTTLSCTRVDGFQCRVHIGICLEKCSRRALCMTPRVEIIYPEFCIRKEIRLARHTIRSQCTCKIIDDTLGWLLPSCNQCREDVISTLALWDAMEAITYAMGTPDAHNASG
jgi:hypothetical protein